MCMLRAASSPAASTVRICVSQPVAESAEDQLMSSLLFGCAVLRQSASTFRYDSRTTWMLWMLQTAGIVDKGDMGWVK